MTIRGAFCKSWDSAENPPGVKVRYKLLQNSYTEKSAQTSAEFSDLIAEARAKLAELRGEYTDEHLLVKAQSARLSELERMAREEPNVSAVLRETKAKLAEMRVEFTDRHPDVQKLKERIRAMEEK